MGAKRKKIIRVVLDTNVILSSILFRGDLALIYAEWISGTIVPIVSRETFEELTRALAYPKFRLTKEEIASILTRELLPYLEVVEISGKISGTSRDPHDDKFIECAVSAKADYIVSGDGDLQELKEYQGIRIISPRELLKILNR